MKQKLFIDCQVFQTSSWHRGMGKYSLSLLEHFFSTDKIKKYDVTLIFNQKLPIPEEVNQRLKSYNVAMLDLELPKEPRTDYSVAPISRQNKAVLDEYLEGDLSNHKVTFFILALYLDEVCPAFPSANENLTRALVYYDSIPLLYHERYGQFKGFFDNFYLPHTATVLEADTILTISQTVANDLHIMLGVDSRKIVNIDGANIALKVGDKPSFELSGDYILMPSGQELRKNNHRAVEAFEIFRKRYRPDMKLVITSSFNDEAREQLSLLSEGVIFTGNVSESDLGYLYDNCKFVLFATEYEGLGLPILEAVAASKHIACSNISVFKEMSQKAFTVFDPLDTESIAEGLHQADIKAKNEKLDTAEYSRILKKYDWSRTAKVALEALQGSKSLMCTKRRKVAIFCPDPEGFSAIGKVVAESHSNYSEYFEIDYYFDRGPNHRAIRPNFIKYATDCYDAESATPKDLEKYDSVIYHVGNSEYHLNIIRMSLAYPGYVIFHDTNLKGAYHSLLEHGFITETRLQLEERLDALATGKHKDVKSSFLTSIANGQKAIIVHSEYAKKAVKDKLLSAVEVEQVNLPVSVPIFPEIAKKRRSGLTISFGGIIARVKGTNIIEEIARSDEFSELNIQIFGYSAVEPELMLALDGLPNVKLVTNPSDFEFQQLMASTDILINVRLEYKGETSLTTLECMRFGGLPVIRDFGWYSELPDQTVVKIENPDDTLAKLREIVEPTKKNQVYEMGDAGMLYVRNEHSHKMYAEKMYNLISKIH